MTPGRAFTVGRLVARPDGPELSEPPVLARAAGRTTNERRIAGCTAGP